MLCSYEGLLLSIHFHFYFPSRVRHPHIVSCAIYIPPCLPIFETLRFSTLASLNNNICHFHYSSAMVNKNKLVFSALKMSTRLSRHCFSRCSNRSYTFWRVFNWLSVRCPTRLKCHPSKFIIPTKYLLRNYVLDEVLNVFER